MEKRTSTIDEEGGEVSVGVVGDAFVADDGDEFGGGVPCGEGA